MCFILLLFFIQILEKERIERFAVGFLSACVVLEVRVKEHRQLQAYLDFHCLSLRLGLAWLGLPQLGFLANVHWNGRHLRAYAKWKAKNKKYITLASRCLLLNKT